MCHAFMFIVLFTGGTYAKTRVVGARWMFYTITCKCTVTHVNSTVNKICELALPSNCIRKNLFTRGTCAITQMVGARFMVYTTTVNNELALPSICILLTNKLSKKRELALPSNCILKNHLIILVKCQHPHPPC